MQSQRFCCCCQYVCVFRFFILQDDEDPNEKSHNEDDAKEDTGEIENVRVVVRVRPMDQAEIDSGSANVVKVDKLNRCINVTKINASSSSAVSEPPKRYYFDNVFGEDSTQVCILFSCQFVFISDICSVFIVWPVVLRSFCGLFFLVSLLVSISITNGNPIHTRTHSIIVVFVCVSCV